MEVARKPDSEIAIPKYLDMEKTTVADADRQICKNVRKTTSLAMAIEESSSTSHHQQQSSTVYSTSPYCSSWLSKYGGIFFAFLTSIFTSLTFLDMKILQKKGFPPFGTAVLFNLWIIIPTSTIILIHDLIYVRYDGGGQLQEGTRKKILREIWPLTQTAKRRTFKILTLQGTLQSLSVVFRSYSLQYLDIGDMTVIVFSSPILTTIIAHFVVGEPCGAIFILIALYTFSGVILITKPPLLVGSAEFDAGHLIGIGLAAGALLSLSMKFVITRKIQDSNVFLMSFFLGSLGFLVSFPLFLIFEDWATLIPQGTEQWLQVLGLFGAFCAIVCINSALKLENAGPVALVRSLDVLFAFLLQYFVLNVIPDLLSSLGAIIVISGVFAVGARKWILSTKYGQVRCSCCA